MGRAIEPRKEQSRTSRRAQESRKAMVQRPSMMGKGEALVSGSKSSARQHTLSARKPGELVGALPW